MPARIESAPRLGPIVRSSTMVSLAGSEPARSRMARSLARSATVKLPLIWPEPPRIGCGSPAPRSPCRRARWRTAGRHWPASPRRTCGAPAVDRRKLTTGSLVWLVEAPPGRRPDPRRSSAARRRGCRRCRRSPRTARRWCPASAASVSAPLDRALDEMEGELRRLADDRLQPCRVAEAGRLDQDAVVALALDARLGRAELVDAAADDLDRLADDAADALRQALRRIGEDSDARPG